MFVERITPNIVDEFLELGGMCDLQQLISLVVIRVAMRFQEFLREFYRCDKRVTLKGINSGFIDRPRRRFDVSEFFDSSWYVKCCVLCARYQSN